MRTVWSSTALALLLLLQTKAVESAPLRLAQTIPLPEVEGRIDHLAADITGQRLFVSALGNNTVEIIDLKTHKQIRNIRGLSDPQGIVYVPESNRLFVDNGGDGSCQVFDGEFFKPLARFDFKEDADNLRYDAPAGTVYTGFGNGAIGIIDAKELKPKGEIKLTAHPESFQLEGNGDRIFVNVPAAGEVIVLDRKKKAVIANWPIKGARANFPMALDEANHRLFVGCRQPATLIIFATESGKEISRFNIDHDADDIFYDAGQKRIYVVCGAGFIDIFQQTNTDNYRQIGKIPTAPGARTGLFVPEWNRLYLAVPHRGKQGAEIQIYDIPD